MIHLQDLIGFQEIEVPFNHIETRLHDFLNGGDLVQFRDIVRCLMDDDEIVKNIKATFLHTNPSLLEEDFRLFTWSGAVPPDNRSVSGFLIKVRDLVVFHRVTLHS